MDKFCYCIDISTIITRCIMTITILIGALAMSGNWLVFYVNVLLYSYNAQYNSTEFETNCGIIYQKSTSSNEIPQSATVFKWYRYFNDLRTFWISSIVVGFAIYFLFGITFHWYFYVKQKNKPEMWKCQPKRWLNKELEIDEIKLGCLSLFVASTWTSLLSTYLSNGGYSTLYYKWNEYGVLWFILQIPVLFLSMDYLSYWWHRLFHLPFLYNRFHKFHHKYVQPTAFSVTAVHPFELSVEQFILILPIFTIPTYWVVYHMIIIYNFYEGILNHSGINFKAHWWQPWQPNSIFHDNHHQYYHVNFGFNVEWWDKLHNTYRWPNKVYDSKHFYGKGIPLDEIDSQRLEIEIAERLTESRTAFDNNKNPYIEYLSRIGNHQHFS